MRKAGAAAVHSLSQQETAIPHIVAQLLRVNNIDNLIDRSGIYVKKGLYNSTYLVYYMAACIVLGGIRLSIPESCG